MNSDIFLKDYTDADIAAGKTEPVYTITWEYFSGRVARRFYDRRVAVCFYWDKHREGRNPEAIESRGY